jgi:hypothetical protein
LALGVIIDIDIKTKNKKLASRDRVSHLLFLLSYRDLLEKQAAALISSSSSSSSSSRVSQSLPLPATEKGRAVDNESHSTAIISRTVIFLRLLDIIDNN